MTRQSVVGAIAALGGGEIAARLVGFATAALLARRLGPEGFGILGFAAAVCSYFALAVTGGLNDLAARDVGRRPPDAGSIYRSVVAIRLPLALAALAVLALVAWWIPRPPTHRLVLILSGLSFMSLAIDPLWAAKALGRTGVAASAMVVSQGILLIGAIVVVTRPADVAVVPVLQFAAEATVAVVLGLLLLRTSTFRASLSHGLALLREGMPILFGRGMRAVIVSFDIVMLGFIASSRDVGLYAAVYRLHFFVLALMVALQAAYLPVMARAATRELRAISNESLGSAAVIGAPLVAGGIVIADPLLTFLFGPPYADGARALQWLLVSLAFVFVHGLLHNVYVVTGRTDLEARWLAAAAGVNVLANLLLIPRFGIAGAAAATALAEGVIVGGAFVSRIALPTTVLGAWAKPALAASAMALVVWATGNGLPVPVRCAIGAVVYGIAIVGLLGPRVAAIRSGWQ